MPLDGVVNRVSVDPGEYVLAGQRIMLVHDPSAIRIEADAKQTELRHFRIGAPVRVTLDAWGWRAVFFLSRQAALLSAPAPRSPSPARRSRCAGAADRRRAGRFPRGS
ncbi:HlyD family efflux transporter periplasmic adaptor subunit [Rubritepida flocculans]|uniref:HlyD family efflux transporter periplasmic adaptor subunit n=1 Tax=Rubritepida flocculans TaxID=182403 RepID=UPI0009FD2811